MSKPIIIKRFTDNGAFSHWALIHSETGDLLWSEAPEEELQKTEYFKELESVKTELQKVREQKNLHQKIANHTSILAQKYEEERKDCEDVQKDFEDTLISERNLRKELKKAQAERDELREALDDKTKRFNTACNQWDQLKKVLDQTEEELKGFKLAEEHQRKNAVSALLDLGKCQEEVQRLTALLTSLGHEQD